MRIPLPLNLIPNRSVNPPLFFILCLLLIPLSSETLPQRYPLERYEDLRNRLPFGKPTVIETEAAKPPSFTEDLTLLGFSKFGSHYFVTLSNKKTQQKIFLSPKDKPDGITIVEVLNHADLTKVEIKLQKGTEIASVKFDPNYLAPPKPGNPMPGNPFPTMPSLPPVSQNGIPPNQLPQAPVPIALPLPNQNPPQNTPTADGRPPTPQTIDPNNPSLTKRVRRVVVPPQSP